MTEKTEGKHPKGTGARWAYQQIQEMILSNEIGPGADLDEARLIELLGLSRTPIREALIQLTAEGLVELLPNRGARVSNIDLAVVREFFEALNATQRMVTRWAAIRRRKGDIEAIDGKRVEFEAAAARNDVEQMTRINVDFHIAIGNAAGNSFIAKTYTQLLVFGMRLSRIALVYEDATDGKDKHIKKIIDEHRQLSTSIVTGDADKAEQFAGQHSELFRDRVLTFMSSNLASKMTFS